MGRPTKAGHVVRKHQEEGVDLGDLRVQGLTATFREFRQRCAIGAVSDVIESGRILRKGRDLLKRNYNHWLEALDVSRKTADNHTNLADFADDHPALIQKWGKLGPTKLYKIARVDPDERRRILSLQGIEKMTDAEFALHFATKERPEGITGNQIGHGFSEAVKAMYNRLERFESPKIEDPDVKKRLRDQLLAVAEKARALATGLR